MAYRRQAANRGSLDWVTVDVALYNEVFAGRAKLMSQCRYCLADTHYSQDCVHAPSGVEILPSSVPRIVDSPPGRAGSQQPGASCPQECRDLPPIQCIWWFTMQVQPMSLCTCVHKVQASTPSCGVWREAPADHT